MSTLSEAKKLLKGSEGESAVNYKAIAMGLAGAALMVFFVNILGRGSAGVPFGLSAQRDMPQATAPVPDAMPTMAVFAMDSTPTVEPTATAWPTPIIIEREVVSVVTVEVPGQSVYVEVPGPVVEVTRIVEVASFVFPTVTPVPLAPGTVKICASVEGATGLYIGQQGVVSGGCETFSFGVGQTTIGVQINR